MTGPALLLARLKPAEGERFIPYDDATGKTVKAPEGHITWGWGFNLEKCGSPGLFAAMGAYLIGDIERQLKGYRWYDDASEVRQSVFLEIAYNGGVSGLVTGYPLMLAAARMDDWETAARQCHAANPKLAGRYSALAELLRQG